MFYKKFSKIIDAIGEESVEKFDFWLSTLPDGEAQSITISAIASRLEIPFSVAKLLVLYSENVGILQKRYEIVCDNDNCNFPFGIFSVDQIIEYMGKEEFCHECDENFLVSDKNIYVVYKRILRPDVSDKEIEKVLIDRLGFGDEENPFGNFSNADSLSGDIDELFEIYYKPDESAYMKLIQLKDKLNGPFKTTKEKGDALEELSLYLFKQIKNITGTNLIKTYTNQFDCTIRFPQTSDTYPTILKYMTPYFIIECKNEMGKSGSGKTPSNTYFHKLSNIMSSNDAQLGIVLSRGEASTEDISIAHDNYLLWRNSNRQRVLLSLSDNDLEALINKRINLLRYLSYKMDMLTIHARNATYEMFERNNNED